MTNLKSSIGLWMTNAFVILALVFLPKNGLAQLNPAAIFGNNAVLQQGIKVPLWGTGTKGTIVHISFGKTHQSIKVGENGNWMIRLPKMKADGKTYQLKIINGKDSIIYHNIMIGEVWLASGQSNMAYAVNSDLNNKAFEIENANYPNIRYRSIENITSIKPSVTIRQQDWKVCTPQTIGNCSAVAYFFARALHQDKNVPVGIIVSAKGSTSIESWMSKDALIQHPDFTKDLQNRDEDSMHWLATVASALKANADREIIANTSFNGLKLGVHQIDFDDANWKQTAYPISCEKMGYGSYWGMVWFRKSFKLDTAQSQKNFELYLPLHDQNDIVYLNGKELTRGITKLTNKSVAIPKGFLKQGNNALVVRMYVNYAIADIGDRQTDCFIKAKDGDYVDLKGFWKHSNKIEPEVASWQGFHSTSTVNFNAMIYPIIPYGIKGFLWYQGENNASGVKIKQYESLQPMLIKDWRNRWQQGNIPFLFVQLPNYKARLQEPIDGDNWSLFRAVQQNTLKNTPNTGMICTIDIGDEFNIHPGNKQDVGKRLYLLAKEKVYKKSIVGNGPQFKTAKLKNGQLKVSFTNAKGGLSSKDSLLNNCFAVSDTSGKWHWCNALINGSDILIDIKNISGAKMVQYAWQSNPYAPVYNMQGLPMLPFKENINK